MTAYVDIADSEIDPESPYTTTLATKNRDNPIAITEGSSGAPKIQLAAIDSGVLSRELVSTATASASATIDFTGLDSTYAVYEVELVNVLLAGGSLYSRVQTGGATWQTGAVYTDYNANANTLMKLNQAAVSTTSSDGGLSGIIRLYNPAGTTHHKVLNSLLTYEASGDNFMDNDSLGAKYNATTAVTGLRFYSSAGNVVSGTFNLYGVN